MGLLRTFSATMLVQNNGLTLLHPQKILKMRATPTCLNCLFLLERQRHVHVNQLLLLPPPPHMPLCLLLDYHFWPYWLHFGSDFTPQKLMVKFEFVFFFLARHSCKKKKK